MRSFYGRIRGAINGQIGVERGEPHMSDHAEPAGSAEFDDKTRRDFLFTTTATANSCHSYADHTPSYPSTWPTHGKYVKFVCSGTNVELFGLCSKGCATSTCQEIKTFKPEEVVGKCLEQTTTGYLDYKIIELKLPCDASSATTSATTSYLASACTVVAFMLLQT